MNRNDCTNQEEQFDLLLAAADDALATGNSDLLSCVAAAPAELRFRLQRELAWCQKVRRLWPQTVHSTRSPRHSTVRIPLASAGDLPATNVGGFQIVRELGRGGFGVVFLAIDQRLICEVALKMPREAL
jgi:hypothetical protein